MGMKSFLAGLSAAILLAAGIAGAQVSGGLPFGTAGSPNGNVLSVQGVASGTAVRVDLSGTAANATAIKVDGSAVTQPISAASLPLPTGAATSAKQPALGTAGSASTDVLTVQGIASMTALKVDGSAVTQPVSIAGNQPVNVAQINGVTPLMGNGTTGTGSHRVTIASDNSNSAGIGGSATGSAVPSAARYIGGNGSGNLTGITVCDTRAKINQTAGAQIITGTASKKTYICSINLVTATAQNIAIVEGTGVTCGTGTAGVSTGGTTAATGWNLAANGGLTQGSGLGVIMAADSAAADNVCILQSGTGQVSGVISYTQF